MIFRIIVFFLVLYGSATAQQGNGYTPGPGNPSKLYSFTSYGGVCNDSTDDTTAFNALLTTVYNAGGGTIFIPATCLISGAVVFPNNFGQ
jgi:hypothetical protein